MGIFWGSPVGRKDMTLQSALVPPLKPKIEGWLLWFVVRFYLASAFAFSGAVKTRSSLYIVIGAIELSLGVLLSLKNRTGLVLTRVWLILETLVFSILALLAFMPPSETGGAIQMLFYAIGSAMIAVYFFRSKRVQATYPKT